MKRSGYADLPLHGGRVPVWLAERMQKLGTAMNLTRGLQQQIGQGGVQIRPRKQFDCGSDEIRIVCGNVFAEIDGSLGKFEFVEITDATRITIGLFEVQELDAGRQQELGIDEFDQVAEFPRR